MNALYFTGLSAVSGLRYGGVADHPDGRTAVYEIWAEGFAVGWAEELVLERVLDVEPRELVDRGLIAQKLALPVAAGVRERQNGNRINRRRSGRDPGDRVLAVAAHVHHQRIRGLLRAHGIATPFNDRVVEVVHAMERGERSPAAEELTELVAAVRA